MKHCLAVSFCRDVCGALHVFNLFRAFEEAHLVNDRASVYDSFGRAHSFPRECAKPLDLMDDRFVQIGVAVAYAVIKIGRAVQVIANLLFKLIDWKSFVRAVLTFSALDACASSVPYLSFGIARPDK